MTIANQSLKLLIFYTNPTSVESWLVPAFKQAFDLEASKENAWQGKTDGGDEIRAEICLTHDTLLLLINLAASSTEESWDSLSQSANRIVEWVTTADNPSQPWACSRLYYCNAPLGISASELSVTVNQVIEDKPAPKPETTPFGWLWLLGERANGKTWQRDYLLIIPEDRYSKVKPLFIESHQSGFTRIELYLQKCKHLTRQHESIRVELSTAINTLQQEMLEHLVTSDFSQIQSEPVLMETMSRQLMHFLTQKAAVEILHNSLNVNRKLLEEHLERIKLEAPLFIRERDKVSRQIEQIETDLQNASVIEESVSAVQDIQRSAEASRFERSSYLLGYTAALLAGISLFNSFLDIWGLVLDNSSWVMPVAWIRILLSTIASIAIPLAATWLISRKKWPAIIASIISIAAILGMLISTILTNL